MVSELTIGSVGISLILMIILRMIFNRWAVKKDNKPFIAIGLGILLSAVSLIAANDMAEITKGIVAAYLVQGFMTGATAVGLNEIIKPRNQPPVSGTGSGGKPKDG